MPAGVQEFSYYGCGEGLTSRCYHLVVLGSNLRTFLPKGFLGAETQTQAQRQYQKSASLAQCKFLIRCTKKGLMYKSTSVRTENVVLATDETRISLSSVPPLHRHMHRHDLLLALLLVSLCLVNTARSQHALRGCSTCRAPLSSSPGEDGMAKACSRRMIFNRTVLLPLLVQNLLHHILTECIAD